MEKAKKNLKFYSIFILLLVAVSCARLIVDACVNGIPVHVTEGMSLETAKTISKIAFGLSFVIFLPQLYVALKGWKISNGAITGKAPRVWAVILTVCFAISAIRGFIAMFDAFSFNSFVAMLDPLVDAIIFASVYLCMRKIAKA